MPKNLLYILGSRNRGGVEKRFINYFVYLSQQNKHQYNYHLVINRSIIQDSERKALEIDTRLKTYYYGRKNHNFNSVLDKKGHLFLLLLKLIQMKLKYSFDIIHFITTTSLNFAFLFKKTRFKATSLYSSGHISEILSLPVIRKTSKSGFHYDCLSETVQSLLMKTLNVKAENAHTAPGSFIDLSNTKFNISEKENLIVWAGALNKQKGIPLLIDFLPYLEKEFSDFKLIILGKGEYEQELINKIEQIKLTNKVSITYTNQPKDYFRKSKVFLSFQENDNYPSQSLLEAMACGNVIIATNEGETYKIVNNSNGILIRRNAIEAKNALKQLLDNDLKTMSQNARNIVIENHTIENYHKHLLHIYNQQSETNSSQK